jgi:glycosyltransferase involved in cell wall biosynthesis
LVSVIIPVYNAAAYLDRCINSVINQTWQPIELIIIDDGSKDGSLSIANSYKNKWIKIISQENKGASAARNNGIINSKGEFIQFLDADDLLSPDKIENQVKLLINYPDKVAVCSTVHFLDEENPFSSIPSDYEESFLESCDDPQYFLTRLWGGLDGKGSMIQPNAWLIPKKILLKAGNWNEQLTLDDDGEFFCRIILSSSGITRDMRSRNYYRKHMRATSLSGDYSEKKLKSLLKSAELKQEHLLSISDTPNTRTAIANLYFSICLICYGRYKGVYRMAKKNLKCLNVTPRFQPVIGGKFIQLIVSLFGWRVARRISILKQKLFI